MKSFGPNPPLNRRDFLRFSAIAGAGLVVAPVLRGGGRDRLLDALISRRATRSTASCLWGVHADPRGSETGESALSHLEAAVGRTFGLERHYNCWDELIPDAHVAWTHNQGRVPYVDWHAWTTRGTTIPWSSIASGSQDAVIKGQAKSVKASGIPMYFAFHHEPEDDSKNGTAAQFRAAYDHVHSIFDRQGVTNVTWVVTLMASTYAGRLGGPGAWVPSKFDVVGVDGYNRYPCSRKGYKSFTDIFGATRAYARKVGKPIGIGEYACVEQTACGNSGGDPRGKAKWLADAGNVIKSWPEIAFVSYSHVTAKIYEYWVDTSQASLNAFTAVGLDPYFN